MKKISSFITGIVLLATPISATAATTLFIKQVVTSQHTGGLLNEDFGAINISLSGHTNWGKVNMVGSGTTNFSLDDFGTYPVDYSVAAGSDPRGIFLPTLGSDCRGIAQKDETKFCTIDWLDVGPSAMPVQPAQTPSVSTPAPAPVQTNVSIPLSQPTTAALQAEGTIPAASTSTPPNEAAQIAALQAQIQELYKILVALLQAKLGNVVAR